MRVKVRFAVLLSVLLVGSMVVAAPKKRRKKRSPKPKPPATPQTQCTVKGHRLLISGTELGYVYLISKDGKVEWSQKIDGPGVDLSQRPNGNVVVGHRSGALEVTPENKVVWQYKAIQGTEVFTAQPLPQNRVMIVVNGTPPRLKEFDVTTGKEVVDFEIPCVTKKVHVQFRVVRKTPKGTYLVPYFSENKVCEFDATGKIVRTIKNIQGPFQAVALPNGNILIAGGTGRHITEVDPNDKIVWKVGPDDLPNEPLKFVAGIQRLSNGNTVFANWAGHIGKAPTSQLLEITPDKKVVWKFNDWTNFWSLANVQVLDPSELGGKSHR